MGWIIRILGNAADLPCPERGMFLVSMDFEAKGGRGHMICSPNKTRALRFDTPSAAHAFYTRSPICEPLRSTDGRPNRPLTAYTISIEPVFTGDGAKNE